MSSYNVLVINSGSSSLKLALIDPRSGHTSHEALAERLGTAEGHLRVDLADGTSYEEELGAAGHTSALDRALTVLGPLDVKAIGHRVVHGGEAFSESVVLNATVIAAIDACAALAPLHNPANLLGIEAATQRFPQLGQVAVFDTAFHQSLPPKAYRYAIPHELYERYRIRRYGFHGTSHRYVAAEAAKRLGTPPEQLQLLSAHLGNGCSACAVRGGRSVDTTMGLTPLEGLVMGSRSGDVDPNLHEFLAAKTGDSLQAISQMLNRRSGLLGLSGSSNDMRTLLAARAGGDERAALAIDVFCYRLAKALLGLCAALTRVDALVFTGGIGEHACEVREETLRQLAVLGIELDAGLNRRHGADTDGRISGAQSRVAVLVVPTHEELVIAREVERLLA